MAAEFCAYYYCFNATGVPEIDEILRLVAAAGKGYHHTDNWDDRDCFQPGEPTYVERIQAAADKAAEIWRSK